jgi:hypothetical protein
MTAESGSRPHVAMSVLNKFVHVTDRVIFTSSGYRINLGLPYGKRITENSGADSVKIPKLDLLLI